MVQSSLPTFLYLVLPFFTVLYLCSILAFDFFNEGITEAQSESELGSEALSDNKQSGSMEREDNLVNQSELEGGTQSDKPTGSMESDDASLKQCKLEDVAPSDKPSGSMERKDDLLKLRGGTQSDTKQSSSLESDNDSLKQGNLEAGQSTAKKRSHSSLDSVLSKRMKKITPLDEKGEHFTGKDLQTSV